MKTVLQDFDKRVEEIRLYFQFLSQIIEDDASLFLPKKSQNKFKKIDKELHKILKANGFLLLYNLIESSMINAITAIYDEMVADKESYKTICDEIRYVWLKYKHRNMNIKYASDSTIIEHLKEVADDVVNNTIMEIEKKSLRFGGNLDADIIRSLAQEYGFSTKTHYSARGGTHLKTIKLERNKLAHGEISFAGCGSYYTVSDMLKFQSQVIIYIRGILKNVNDFIEKKKYHV